MNGGRMVVRTLRTAWGVLPGLSRPSLRLKQRGKLPDGGRPLTEVVNEANRRQDARVGVAHERRVSWQVRDARLRSKAR
jgi:hypothetical protein